MYRTAFAAAALVLFATAGVQSAQATQSAKTQRRPTAAANSRAVYRYAHAHSARQTSPVHPMTHSGGRANLSAAAGKRTPDEVGRSAGLAIRRQLAREQMGLSATSVRARRARFARRPRLERAGLRQPMRDRAYDSAEMESARTGPHPDVEDDQPIEARPDSAAFEAQRPGASSADVKSPAGDRQAPVESAREIRNDKAAQDDDEATAKSASQSDETVDSANEKSENEEAALVIPRGGMPAPLRGSLASLQRQNDRLAAEGLERIENEADLEARIADKLLVPIPASSALTVNAELEENHRYCRPWTAKFLADLARAHEAAFHSPLEVSSAVRTVEYQKRLMETNGNAAPAEGDLVSPHLTGATIDIAKSGLSRNEIAWMRRRLAGLQAAGKIDVEEEFKQACFHITVYKSYAPERKAGGATPSKPAAHSTTPRRTADPAGEPAAQGT